MQKSIASSRGLRDDEDMRFLLILVVSLIYALAGLPLGAQEENETQGAVETAEATGTVETPRDETPNGRVVVIPVQGAITEAQFFFMRRALKQAESSGAVAIVLDMDTPGGALNSTERISQMLLRTNVRLISYVDTKAASAGALIAMSTPDIYMAPVSAIGAAAPVMGTGQEIPSTMAAKIVSFNSAWFRSVAEKQGHSPELVDAFMSVDKEVKIGDHIISPKGEVLTLNAQEATRPLVEGQPPLARGIAPDIESLCRDAGLGTPTIVRAEPSGFETLAQLVTMFAPLFLLGGMIGAWIEFKTPGFGVAGVVAAICFLLFFTGHYIAGLTGYEVMVVFVFGVVLVFVELLFFPGAIFIALTGVCLMVGSLLFAMVDFYPAQPFKITPEMFARPALNFAIALGATIFFGALLARILPDAPLFRRLVLQNRIPEGSSLSAPRDTLHVPHLSVGDKGTTRTMLRPAGKAQFGETLVDVVADGDFLESGTQVRILRTDDMATVVDRV